MLRLYDTRLSGNAWKVRILLRQLGLPFERVTLDLAKGEQNDPAFKAMSRFARVPMLELDEGRTIVESAAIMLYLAQGTRLLPDDSLLRADVTSWLFFEQGDLQRALALPRFWTMRGLDTEKAGQIAEFRESAYPALQKADDWLAMREWLAADRYTIADLGLFAYVSMAPEGGYDLGRFPAIGRWIERVKSQPDWVPLVEEG